MLIDVTIPGDRNVIKKQTEKISKYKDLIIKFHLLWNVKAKMMPEIIGRLEPFQNHADNTSEQRARRARNLETAKKKESFGNGPQTAERTNVKVQNIFHGPNNITFSTNCKYRTTAILYTLET